MTSIDAETLPDCLRLLVIEDEALVAMLIEDALALAGHEVVGVADTGADALRIAGEREIDLALCDVRLAAGDSGVAVAHQLAARGVPVMYLSGNCPAAAEHPLVIGCVSKPFHTASLCAAVEAAYRAARGDRPERLPSGLTLFP